VRYALEWIGRWLFGAIALGSGIFSLVREGMGLYLGQHTEPRTAFERSMIVAFVISAAIAWGQERHAALQERRRYDARFKGLPRLQIKSVTVNQTKEKEDSSPVFGVLDYYAQRDSFPMTVYTLIVEFVNNPPACTQDSVAAGVSATLTFYGDGGTELCSVEGRWSKMPVKHGPNEYRTERTIDAIQINELRQLIVAMKDEVEDVCYGTSVDTFQENGFAFRQTGSTSPWVLRGKHIAVLVRLRGILVDQCWLLTDHRIIE
jgi:hypothetical protein